MNAVKAWFSERIPVSQAQLAELTNEPVPNHLKRWWFCLGGTPAYLFVVQIFTGILLAFYYQPAPGTAYESVQNITHDVAYGWYFRSVHKWAATMMVATVILHQMRVYFTGAYRKPREINWMVGMCLLLCTLVTGFTGYSLVYEQLSYWGATVAANISDTVPVLGVYAKEMLLAGETYNKNTLPRFYILHAAVLPSLIIFLLVIHIGIIRLQGVTEFEFEDEPPGSRKEFDFFPDHFYTELIMGEAVYCRTGLCFRRRVSGVDVILCYVRFAQYGFYCVHHVYLAVYRCLAAALYAIRRGERVDRHLRGFCHYRPDSLGGSCGPLIVLKSFSHRA